MVDPDLVTRKMLLIGADLRSLAPIATKPLAAYLASETDEVLVERWLERIIGRDDRHQLPLAFWQVTRRS